MTKARKERESTEGARREGMEDAININEKGMEYVLHDESMVCASNTCACLSSSSKESVLRMRGGSESYSCLPCNDQSSDSCSDCDSTSFDLSIESLTEQALKWVDLKVAMQAHKDTFPLSSTLQSNRFEWQGVEASGLVNQLVVSKNEFECKFWLVISTVVTRLGPQLQNWVRSHVAPA